MHSETIVNPKQFYSEYNVDPSSEQLLVQLMLINDIVTFPDSLNVIMLDIHGIIQFSGKPENWFR